MKAEALSKIFAGCAWLVGGGFIGFLAVTAIRPPANFVFAGMSILFVVGGLILVVIGWRRLAVESGKLTNSKQDGG